uniref:Uncharacterized protein n=1 Tax=Opuntia streptacantha TaxID=393608 RepID=A0A7C9CZC3_OPUST
MGSFRESTPTLTCKRTTMSPLAREQHLTEFLASPPDTRASNLPLSIAALTEAADPAVLSLFTLSTSLADSIDSAGFLFDQSCSPDSAIRTKKCDSLNFCSNV